MSEIDQGITIESGASYLNFLARRTAVGKSEVSINVYGYGELGEYRPIAYFVLNDAKARVFLNAVARHDPTFVSSGTYSLEYDITEKGHMFSLQRYGRLRAIRKFMVGFSSGIESIVNPLLLKMNERPETKVDPQPDPRADAKPKAEQGAKPIAQKGDEP